ncbi:MAG: DUF1957 domain-containing protein [Bacillota bacterium]|nr:DUF1957 domain-containing protein [Bacillota bacterium]
MADGFLALVLHAHLPYVRHPEQERFLEEHWYYQALTECYLPLARVLQGLLRDGVDFCLTLSVSPTLMAMFEDPLLQGRYRRYLERLLGLAAKEKERLKDVEPFAALPGMYEARLLDARALLDDCRDNPLAAFVPALQAGRLELITTAATHGYLPLIRTREARRAQIAIGVQEYARRFGGPPPGFWLPECGYLPGVDELLREQGVGYFFAETHGVLYARPFPRRGVYAPVACPSGVAVFGRDPESSRQVWDRTVGYPGDPYYREYYRDIGYELEWEYLESHLPSAFTRCDTGFKYYRITGGVREKEPYDPAMAAARAERDAAHFLESRELQVQYLGRNLDRPPLIVAPYDAELFGHWWYEGPQWLDALCRLIHRRQGAIRLTTPGRYLRTYPSAQTVELSLSSWGAGGYSEVWLNPANDWIYPRLHRMEKRMRALADLHGGAAGFNRRLLTQAARELLLAQSSDWAFILKTGTATDYANRRLAEHIGRFDFLVGALAGETPLDEARLAAIEARNPLFQELDFRLYSHHYQAPAARSAAGVSRVLMLSWEFPPRTVGGLGRHVYDLSRALARLGVTILVLTAPAPGLPEREEVEGVQVLRLAPGAVDSEDFLTWVGQLNRGMVGLAGKIAPCDLVHAHDWLVGEAGVAISRRWGCPLIATIHATEHGRHRGLHNALQRHIHQQEQHLADRARVVICCSRFMAGEVSKLFGVPRGKVRVIPNGVEPESLRVEPQKQKKAATGKRSVLFIGRLVPEKGVQVLIEALAQLAPRSPDLLLTVAGRGPWEVALRNQVQSLGLGERVAFPGFVDGEHKNRLFAEAAVAVFPSLYEPFGIVALEAMAAGVPVIVSDTGGLAEVVEHGVDGFKVPPGRADLLAYYLEEVIRSPALGSQLARSAWQKVITIYDWDRIAEQTREVYAGSLATGGESDGAAAGGR